MIASNVQRLEAFQTIERQLSDAAVDKDEAAQLLKPSYIRQTFHVCVEHLIHTCMTHALTCVEITYIHYIISLELRSSRNKFCCLNIETAEVRLNYI